MAFAHPRAGLTGDGVAVFVTGIRKLVAGMRFVERIFFFFIVC